MIYLTFFLLLHHPFFSFSLPLSFSLSHFPSSKPNLSVPSTTLLNDIYLCFFFYSFLLSTLFILLFFISLTFSFSFLVFFLSSLLFLFLSFSILLPFSLSLSLSLSLFISLSLSLFLSTSLSLNSFRFDGALYLVSNCIFCFLSLFFLSCYVCRLFSVQVFISFDLINTCFDS